MTWRGSIVLIQYIVAMILQGSLWLQVGLVSDYDLLALDSISGKFKISSYILPFEWTLYSPETENFVCMPIFIDFLHDGKVSNILIRWHTKWH